MGLHLQPQGYRITFLLSDKQCLQVMKITFRLEERERMVYLFNVLHLTYYFSIVRNSCLQIVKPYFSWKWLLKAARAITDQLD